MKLLTLREAAKELRVDYETARLWVHQGKLRGTRLGGRRTINVRPEDIDAFIEASGNVPAVVPESTGKLLKMSPKRQGRRADKSNQYEWVKRYGKG